MGVKHKIGDWVRAKVDCGLRWTMEEICTTKLYCVAEVKTSKHFGDYVQLEGVYSSYKHEWLEKVGGPEDG